MIIRTGLGQDSHRFLPTGTTKLCVIGGVIVENSPGFNANSDGDIVFHAICNAITSLTGELILGGVADELCLKEGITDSEVYLLKALESLGNQKISHVAVSIEGKRPNIKSIRAELIENIARVLKIKDSQVGLTATTGEGLTDFGCGEGIQCLAIVTTMES